MPLPPQIIDATLGSAYGEKAYKLVEQLQDAGYDTWWVGGGVRDMMMGMQPKDIDIGTEATPEQIKTVFPKATQDPNALGSMRVPMGKMIFEVTTFREDDTASDGRHPEAVLFSTREKDAHRRDFTINTLYFHPISRELYDPFNGERDLKERLIRFIGDPVTRIQHDALRMMRAVRFRALIDGQYDPETYKALHEQTAMLEALSHTRKFEELQKMLLTPRPDRALEDLWELDMLQHFLPELHACKGLPQPRQYHTEGDVWDHLMACIRSFQPEHGIDVRLAALLHDIGKVDTYELQDRIRSDEHASVSADAADEVLSRLQCPVKRREKITWLIRHHMMMATLVDDSLPEERASHWYHHPWFTELLQLFWLDIMGTTPHRFGMYDDILKRYHHFLDTHPRPPKPLLNGQEVMDILGLKPGEKVGEILKALYAAQLRKDITTKKEAQDFLQKYSR
jgi:tRNA nucleotidyltransferase/poly(A) polymerase